MNATKEAGAYRNITEVAAEFDLPAHVLRFWETKFRALKPTRSGGIDGRHRYYSPGDVELLRGIRHLLYVERYQIAGVQRLFKLKGADFVREAARAAAKGSGK